MNESEKGSYVLPSDEYVGFKNSFYSEYTALYQELFNKLKIYISYAKQGYPSLIKDWKTEYGCKKATSMVSEELARIAKELPFNGENIDVFCSSILEYGKNGELKTPTNINLSKFMETSLTHVCFNDEKHTIQWCVEEGMHAASKAWMGIEGILFLRQLNKVIWDEGGGWIESAADGNKKRIYIKEPEFA
ncbi:hypothetical protein A3715_15235 [Oleiphilus sp. HI0009]|nr:hypothetical protein A3715_15235 [Oleiphilus sp. HI0009]